MSHDAPDAHPEEEMTLFVLCVSGAEPVGTGKLSQS